MNKRRRLEYSIYKVVTILILSICPLKMEGLRTLQSWNMLAGTGFSVVVLSLCLLTDLEKRHV